MSIQGISQAARSAPQKACFESESPSPLSLHDSVEPSRADTAADCSLIPPMMRRADSQQNLRPEAESKGQIQSQSDSSRSLDCSTDVQVKSIPAGSASLQSPGTQEKKSVSVEINKWFVTEDNTSYTIETGGCGAIKIFVEGEKASYSIVFHSFGSQDSKDAAGQIGRYILGRNEKPESVKILNIQPFGISASVNNTVKVIREMISEKGNIKIDGHTVCLNNIDCENYSEFVHLDLEGTEKQILDRYDHLILKSRKMSDDERAMKIRLFQSLPLNARTPEFLRKWSSLTLEEARQLVDGLNRKNKPISEFRNALGITLAKVRSCFTGSKNPE